VTKATCEVFAGRLIEGAAPSSDPDLALHVGSCLPCFRLMTEMRDLPRLADVMHAESLPDPGVAFWAALPARIWTAAEEEGRRPRPAAAVPVGLFGRLQAWIRRPLPAAFAGAVCAAALVLLTVRRPAGPPGLTPPSGEGASIEVAPSDLAEMGPQDLAAVSRRMAEDGDEASSFVTALADDSSTLTPMERLTDLTPDDLRVLRTVLDSGQL
jgi:hypothetical protein